ncbi:hypothetical protein VCHC17A1_2254A, partial [Vibrio cholerae HC-17A1]|jgi:hypothetical protein
MAEW